MDAGLFQCHFEISHYVLLPFKNIYIHPMLGVGVLEVDKSFVKCYRVFMCVNKMRKKLLNLPSVKQNSNTFL